MSASRLMKAPRSFVLISVLVIVASALLVATSLIFAMQTQSMSGAVAAESIQTRALAWSGLQAVISRLNEQRDVMLAGELPELEGQYEVYQTPSRVGLVRLIAFDGAGARQRLVAESGKLDLNSVDEAALVKTQMLDNAAAAAIVAHRANNKRMYQSAAELFTVPQAGISAEMLYGPLDQLQLLDDAQLGTLDVAGRVQARLDTSPATSLIDVLGVHNIEPALQQNGKSQINLNVPWSNDLAIAIEERFGAETVPLIKQIYDSGETFENDKKIIKGLRDFKVEPENWPPILDAFTTERGEFHFGRLNINTASAEALMGLPGITAEQAAQMVSVRDELSPQERATIAWPAIAQILPPESYDSLIGKITTRAFTFRVRLAAGEVDAENVDGLVQNRVIYEAVIDCSAPKPRIAYLRDITQWQAAMEIALQQPSSFDVNDDEQANMNDSIEPSSTLPSDSRTPQSRPSVENKGESPATAPTPTSQPIGKPTQSRRIGRWTVAR